GNVCPFGSGRLKPTTVCAAPLPSRPWQVAHARSKIWAPDALGGSALDSEVGEAAESRAAINRETRTQEYSVVTPAASRARLDPRIVRTIHDAMAIDEL